jgi:deoxyribonuclease V
MLLRTLHSWDLSAEEAVALQRRLAGRVVTDRPVRECKLIAGADISYNRFDPTLYAGVVVLSTSDWTIVEQLGHVAQATFPYRTGLLTFREAPALLEVFAKLKSKPDAVMIDGAGYAHPRRVGLASHIGLWLNRPTIGCAKSRLIGDYEEPGHEAGSSSPLLHKDEVIGSVLRTRNGVKPLFISVGHKIDLASAEHWVLAGCRGYRVPEPTRQAHLLVNRLRQEAACARNA